MDKDLRPSRNKSLGGDALIALAILSLVSLSFARCKHTVGGLMLRTGKSFGMCAGYCFEEWMFTKENTSVTLKSFDDTNRNPQRTVSLPTPPDIWNQITSAANMNTMQNLPGRIGCPDCADRLLHYAQVRTCSWLPNAINRDRLGGLLRYYHRAA